MKRNVDPKIVEVVARPEDARPLTHSFSALPIPRGDFAVEMANDPTIVVSQATLPGEPKVLVLPGN